MARGETWSSRETKYKIDNSSGLIESGKLVKSWQTEGSRGEQGSHVDEGTAASPVAGTLQGRKARRKDMFLQLWVLLGGLREANSQTVGVHM